MPAVLLFIAGAGAVALWRRTRSSRSARELRRLLVGTKNFAFVVRSGYTVSVERRAGKIVKFSIWYVAEEYGDYDLGLLCHGLFEVGPDGAVRLVRNLEFRRVFSVDEDGLSEKFPESGEFPDLEEVDYEDDVIYMGGGPPEGVMYGDSDIPPLRKTGDSPETYEF